MNRRIHSRPYESLGGILAPALTSYTSFLPFGLSIYICSHSQIATMPLYRNIESHSWMDFSCIIFSWEVIIVKPITKRFCITIQSPLWPHICNIICPSIDRCAIRKPFMQPPHPADSGFLCCIGCLTTSRFFSCRYERIALLYQPHYNISGLPHHCIFERSHIIFLNAKL